MKPYRRYTTEEIAEMGEGFYNTKQWKHKRADILRRDHHECVRCKTVHHRFRPANTVHHINHLDEHPELALADDNLISLCFDCHNEVHPEKFEALSKPSPRWDDEKW